ncbi:MAG: apolipoprotein N-acyltransferase [Gemmatimonadetes bacterium]|nr:apolipoprotein N-acyltransferase [Gemmatimonadota bacterium]
MKGLALPRADWPLVIGGALLVCASYPPFHLFVPSFICLVPAVWLIVAGAEDQRPVRRRLVQGFWFGLLSHGLILYWMVIALWHFTPLSALGYAATITILALWTGILFWFVGWAVQRTPLPVQLIFPVAWTALEWIIGHQGDIRFPWLGLGTSLTGYPTIVQIADTIGARGVTLLLAAANAVLAVAWLRRDRRRFAIGSVSGVMVGIGLAAAYGAVRVATLESRLVGRVAAIQPSIGFSDKHDPALFNAIVDSLLHLSQRALDSTRPQLMTWPEAAVPFFFDVYPDWSPRIGAQAQASHVPMLVGGLDLQRYSNGTYDYYNAAFLFDTTGRRDAQPPYHKRFLVPIVERVPFVNPAWFRKLQWFGGFGIGKPGVLYRIPMGRFGVLICYESAFEEESRDYRRRGADFLVNITNDAWFGHTSAPYQHAAHLVMRAIENRIGVARAANNGISEFVDPLGRTYHVTRLDEVTFIADDVKTTDVQTIYSRVGDWVGWLSLMGTAMVAAMAARKSVKREELEREE